MGWGVAWRPLVAFRGTSWTLLRFHSDTSGAIGANIWSLTTQVQAKPPGQWTEARLVVSPPLHAWNTAVRNKAGSCSWWWGQECTPGSILRFLQMRGLWEAIVNFSCVLLQGKSLSNVNLMAVTGSLPIAVIERNTPMSIPATSPTTVRFEAVINPILTQAL